MVDTIQVAIDASTTAGTLQSLRAWFEQTIATLRQ